jgi:hypothetical protein
VQNDRLSRASVQLPLESPEFLPFLQSRHQKVPSFILTRLLQWNALQTSCFIGSDATCQDVWSLASRHGDEDVEQACEIAQSHGAYRLRVIRELIKRCGNKQEQFEFMDDHPIIRSLGEYEQFVQTAFQEANA